MVVVAMKILGAFRTAVRDKVKRQVGAKCMIKSWVFEFFATPDALAERFDPAESQRFFDAYLDLWTSAEPAGFDGIFFSEHHFGASYSPSPNLLIANVALRTRKIRLGVLGVVPPYHSPWQLVEEIGMLDHLTGGRLEIGTAAGIPQELALVGLGVDEARARYDEAVEISRQSPDGAGHLASRQVLEF